MLDISKKVSAVRSTNTKTSACPSKTNSIMYRSIPCTLVSLLAYVMFATAIYGATLEHLMLLSSFKEARTASAARCIVLLSTASFLWRCIMSMDVFILNFSLLMSDEPW